MNNMSNDGWHTVSKNKKQFIKSDIQFKYIYNNKDRLTDMLIDADNKNSYYYTDLNPFNEISDERIGIIKHFYKLELPTETPFYQIKLGTNFMLTDSNVLAGCSKILYDAMMKDFQFDVIDETMTIIKPVIDGFRLSYNFKEQALKLKLPPLTWFDTLLKNNKKRVEIADKWIKSVEAIYGLFDPNKLGVYGKIPVIIQPKEFCRRGIDCYKWKTSTYDKRKIPTCDQTHNWYTCLKAIKNLSKNNIKCKFFIPDDMIIKNDLDPRFLLMVRQDEYLSRDLIFVPKPLPMRFKYSTKSDYSKNGLEKYKDDVFEPYSNGSLWPGHYSNEEYIVKIDTWIYVKKVCHDMIGEDNHENIDNYIEEIAFNFGNWETKISKDLYATECHAHGHIVMTKQGHDFLTKVEKYRPYVSGRGNNPFPYDEKDADELKVKRVMYLKQDLIFSKVDNLETKVDNLETKVDNLETKVDNLETKVDNLETAVDKLCSKIDSVLEHLKK
ncbi:MAG: hypothetical protein ACRCZI_01105 [Cetobacterium sp.]